MRVTRQWTAAGLMAAAVACILTATTGALAGPPKSLVARAAKSKTGIFDLDTAGFNKLVNEGASERAEYSLSVLFTALDAPGIDCAPCKTFQPHYEEVAAAWKRTAGRKWTEGKAEHYFAEVNFVNGREIFGQLQLTHAPILLHIPPGAPASKGKQYDFNAHGFEAPGLAAYMTQVIGKPVGYRKPFPWRAAITFSLAALVTLTATLFIIAKAQQHFETSGGQQQGVVVWKTAATWILQLLSLSTITIMCSGYMWNSIRNAPYMSMGPKGPEYFAGGFQNQHGVETQIVAAIYAILAFSLVALTVLVPAQRDPVKQRAGVYVWSVIFLAGVSVLFAVFRIKNPSYPFRLFL